MSNVLKVSLQTTIYSLAQRGWSQRRIAKELGINRETVGRYLRLPKPAISTAGFEEGEAGKPAISITGNLAGKEEAKPAISITGPGAGRRSRCEALAEVIGAKVEVGLSAQRIYQDLVEQNVFSDSYQSVQRFVRKLKGAQPQRVWRMEARPGEEVQVDFGLGAPILEGPTKPRRSWVLRMVLSYSRKAYSEAVLRQDTETFLRCLENGLRAFGGVPLLLNLDYVPGNIIQVLFLTALCSWVPPGVVVGPDQRWFSGNIIFLFEPFGLLSHPFGMEIIYDRTLFHKAPNSGSDPG
jgi:predicted transcriptional regulator